MPYIGNPSAQRFTSPRAASVFSGDGSNWNIHTGDSGAPPAKPGEWEFRAISRQGANSIKFFHNGIVTKEITTRTDGTTAIGTLYQNSAATLRLGVDSSSNLFKLLSNLFFSQFCSLKTFWISIPSFRLNPSIIFSSNSW